MSINWFPGHMHKARKDIKKALSDVDLVVEILDARIPFSSANPIVKQLSGSLPTLKILNKADLSDSQILSTWQAFFEQEKQTKTLPLVAKEDPKKSTIVQLITKLVDKPKSPQNVTRAMVMGIPNVGKSSLLNALAGSHIAKVGNEPAVTKRQQKISINDRIEIIDTPGMLWPKLEPEACGYRLAATGAVRDTAMDYEPVALFALDYLKSAYPDALQARFKLTAIDTDTTALLTQIGKKRGCLRSGGVVDMHAAAVALINEIRSGKLGGICFETPAMMERELEELREQIRLKQAQQSQQ